MIDAGLLDAGLLDAHERAMTRFAVLVDELPPDARPVPGMSWGTIEVAAHVLSVLRAYEGLALGGPPLWGDRYDGPAENQRLLDATTEREPRSISKGISEAGPKMRAALAGVDGMIEAFGGFPASAETIVGVNLGDVLLHGFDIARAMRRPWRSSRPTRSGSSTPRSRSCPDS